ncbi:MAG: tetratricopeptide repeat protein [Propionibacteriaceae bacterium]|jgi:hypothetical protein|nr:tetratricopeptide repeat protein [Propionibacteriaceae bacterium]
MTQQEAEIQALLDQIDWTEPGPEEYSLVQRAVAMAVEAGDEELEHQARMRATASACWNGDTDAMLANFSWCLAKHDEDPERFPAELDDGNGLMWQYKWMPHALDRSPAFPLEQTEALLADMEARYRRAGLGLSGVASERFSHAWNTGRIKEAKRLRAVLKATPRDSHSDCEACSRSELLGFAVELGEDKRALKLIDEIVENGYDCAEEPALALARSLVVKLRAGRFDDAKASHARSYRLARSNPDAVGTIGYNILFCAITGNEVRALDMVERHLPWLAHDALNDAGRLTLLTAIGLALDSLERIGEGGQVVRAASRPEAAAALGLAQESAPAGGWTARDLAAKVRAQADQLAAAFDARNGNTYVSERLASDRALLESPYDLPIQEAGFIALPAPAPEPADALALLELAHSCKASDLPQRAVEYARRVLELTAGALTAAKPDAVPAAPAPGPAPAWAGSGSPAELRRQALGLVVAGLAEQELAEEAEAALRERLAELRQAGLAAQADVEELAGLSLYAGHDTAALETALARATEVGAPGHLVSTIAVRLASELAEAERAAASAAGGASEAGPGDGARGGADGPADGAEGGAGLAGEGAGPVTGGAPGGAWPRIAELTELAGATAEPGTLSQAAALALRANSPDASPDQTLAHLDQILGFDLPRGQRAGLLRWRANGRGAAGRFEEGAADADEATRLNAELGFAPQGVAASMLAGHLLSDSGQVDAAVARFRYAIRLAALDGDPGVAPKFALGHTLLDLGQAWEAIELFGDVLETERENAAPGPVLADTLESLGRAHAEDGEPGAALGNWDEAADLYEADEQHAPAARLRWRMGNLFRQFADFEEAVGQFDRAMDLLEAAEWEAQGDARPLGVTVLEARALAKASQGDPSALEDVGRAHGIAVADEEPWRAADLLDTRARVLTMLDRDEEAVAQFLQAADSFRAADDLPSGAGAELMASNTLAKRLERPTDARAILSEALKTLSQSPEAQAAAEASGLLEALTAALADLA